VISPDGTVAEVMEKVSPTRTPATCWMHARPPDLERSPGRGLPAATPGGRISAAAMQLFLRDPSYTDRLAAFLTSVGKRAVVAAPNRVDLEENEDGPERLEVELYLRVWSVIHPDADVVLAIG
jgi:hypothetical protein